MTIHNWALLWKLKTIWFRCISISYDLSQQPSNFYRKFASAAIRWTRCWYCYCWIWEYQYFFVSSAASHLPQFRSTVVGDGVIYILSFRILSSWWFDFVVILSNLSALVVHSTAEKKCFIYELFGISLLHLYFSYS